MANFFDASAMAEEIQDAEDLKPHPPGEVSVRIVEFVEGEDGIVRTNKKGHPFILPRLEIFGEDEAYKDFTHYVALPSNTYTEKKEKNRVNLNWRRFCEAFNQDPLGQVDFLDMVGEDTEALIDVTEDEGYGEQNRIIRFIKGK